MSIAAGMGRRFMSGALERSALLLQSVLFLLLCTLSAHAQVIYQTDFVPGSDSNVAYSFFFRSGDRCGGIGMNSSCAFVNIIGENQGLPPYPEIHFPRQTGTIFVRYYLKVPDYFYTGRGVHGYYLYDTTNHVGSATIESCPEYIPISYLEHDAYSDAICLRGSGYGRITYSSTGYEAKTRGQWHSYEFMIIPSQYDPSVGRVKAWVDGELAAYAKSDTIPSYNTFWITNYWHSYEYVDRSYSNYFEKYTAPLHPPFELLLSNLTIATDFVEDNYDAFAIERVRYYNFSNSSFSVNFDTTAQATGMLEWGETPAYGNTVQEQSAGWFHSLTLTALGQNKTYYLRLSANDSQNRSINYTTTFTTPAGAVPNIFFPDWKVEGYQNLGLTGTPVFLQNFKSVSDVRWNSEDSDDIIRTDLNTSFRYSKSQYFTDGDYSVKTIGSDVFRIYIDGVLKVNDPSPTSGHNLRKDFNIHLTTGTHNFTIEEALYRMGDWEQNNSKGFGFVVEPLDTTAPKLLVDNVYVSGYDRTNQPFYYARCDKDCYAKVDYGADTNYGATINSVEESSPRAYVRFPALTLGATYHYRVTLRDMLNNVRVIPDRTFTVVDNIPPRATHDLHVSRKSPTNLTLTLTPPGDDGTFGNISWYDIRYSTSPLNLVNWPQATKVLGLAHPNPIGVTEYINLTGFPTGQTYYFGVIAYDKVNNSSPLSNIASDPVTPDTMDYDADTYGVGITNMTDCNDYDASIHEPSTLQSSGYCLKDTRVNLLVTPTDVAPQISAVAVSSITPISAIVSWTTDTASNSTVNYGLDSGVGSALSDSLLTTYHGILLTGLTPATTYYYKANSCTPAGCIASQLANFTTGPGDITPPNVSINSPLDGDVVNGTVSISVSATDNAAVAYTTLYVDGALLNNQTGASQQVSWNTPALANGQHTIMARAIDTSMNDANTSISVITNNTAILYDGVIISGWLHHGDNSSCVSCNLTFSIGGVNSTATTDGGGHFTAFIQLPITPGLYLMNIIIDDGINHRILRKRVRIV